MTSSSSGVASDISWVYLKVYNSSTSVLTHNWTSFTDNTFYTFTAVQNQKYAVWLQIACASGATTGHTPILNFKLKVNSP